METINGLTVCHECKSIFNGIVSENLICPKCSGNKLTLLSNMGIHDLLSSPPHDCPNLFDWICELTGEDVWAG